MPLPLGMGSRQNQVLPAEPALYVGWVELGECFNMTVRVEWSGVYTADLLYNSSDGEISPSM